MRMRINKDMRKVIKYDLEALKDNFIFKNRKDFDYHFGLLKGNLEELKVIEVNEDD